MEIQVIGRALDPGPRATKQTAQVLHQPVEDFIDHWDLSEPIAPRVAGAVSDPGRPPREQTRGRRAIDDDPSHQSADVLGPLAGPSAPRRRSPERRSGGR
jgi:hypothetical protein